MIHLDTNYLVGTVKVGTPQATQVDAWERAGEVCRVSAMAWAEFLCGPLSPSHLTAAAALIGPPLPVTADDAAAAVWPIA